MTAGGGSALRDRITRSVHRLAPLLFALAFAHPALRLVARWDWRLDLVSHFREAALGLSLVALIACLLGRRRGPAVILAALAAIQAEPIARFWMPNPVPPASASGPRLRILVANVYVDNDDHEALARLIRDVDPDVVGLVEVSDGWVAGLRDVAKGYPHRLDAPAGSRGLSLWFKREPIAIDPPARPSPGGWPYLHARFAFAGAEHHLWLIHPASPMHESRWSAGFPELDALGGRIGSEAGSRVVIGDFNTTDGSPHFRDFLAATGLRDSRLGFGRQGSWPVGSPYQIAIDHALVSDDLAVVARTQGPSIGSDHRPFWIDLAPSGRSPARASAAHDSARAR